MLLLHILVSLFYGAILGSVFVTQITRFFSPSSQHIWKWFVFFVSGPIKSHVDGSRSFCFVVSFKMRFFTVFSVATGVGGCWWPISARAIIMDVAFWKFSNDPPSYDSVADAVTFFIMLHSTCTGSFWGGVDYNGGLGFVHNKKYPPALIRAYGFEI